jgi:hypothetical protein
MPHNRRFLNSSRKRIAKEVFLFHHPSSQSEVEGKGRARLRRKDRVYKIYFVSPFKPSGQCSKP